MKGHCVRGMCRRRTAACKRRDPSCSRDLYEPLYDDHAVGHARNVSRRWKNTNNMGLFVISH